MAEAFHISEEEAAQNFAALMERVSSGEEAVIERAGKPAALMTTWNADSLQERARPSAVTTGTSPVPLPDAKTRSVGRTIAEAREILRLRAETQPLAVPDPDCASDMEAVRAITNAPYDYSRWD